MFRMSHPRRPAAGAAFLAAAALTTAGGAQASPTATPLPPFAVDKTLDYQCKWPLVAPGTVELQIEAQRTPISDNAERWDLSATATIEAPTPYAFNSVDGLAAFDGTLTLALEGRERLSDAASTKSVDLTLPRTPVPRAQGATDERTLTFTGAIPSWETTDFPLEQVSLTEVPGFTLRATDEQGTALELPAPKLNWSNEPYAQRDQDVETFDLMCRLDPAVPGQTLDIWNADGSVVNQPPTTPTGLKGSPGSRAVGLQWNASTDVDGTVASYRVYRSDQAAPVAEASGTSATVTGLGSGSTYTFYVVAVDDKGRESAKSESVTVTTNDDVITLPGPMLTATPGDRSVTLKWSPAAVTEPVQYRVYVNGSYLLSVPGATRSATLDGLVNGRQYSFVIAPVDRFGVEGRRSAEVRVTPQAPQPVLVAKSYSLAGSASIKTLSKGALSITGGIDAQLDTATGAIEADLRLNPTSGRLTALGFLPVTAKIGFVPSGKTVGTLLDGQLNTTSTVRIKVQEVKLFGAIPLAGGNSCQTKSLSEIKLKNTQEFFDYLKGGPIAGTFAISDLNGCGVLNGLVSPLTAGGGNTLNLTLTPTVG